MGLENCSDCPTMCFGNTLDSDCVVYDGKSLRTYLDSIGIPSSNGTSSPEGDITTDDITSKSLVRDTSNLCASNIVKRDFYYTLSSGASTSTFAWNMVDIRTNLPTGYRVGLVRVRASGSTAAGRNVIADSSSISGGVSLGPNNYPVTVDFMLRITSPCGDIDMQKTITLQNPSKTGKFVIVLDARDLNPQSGEIPLTDQLNMIEDNISNLQARIGTIPDNSITVLEHGERIESLEERVDEIGSEQIDYVKDGGNKTASISSILNDLYVQIESLKSENLTQSIQIESLQAQIDSINAS